MINNKITFESFNDCLVNNYAMCTTLIGEKTRIMIIKYSQLDTWEIKVLEKDKDHVLNIYNDLHIYDAYNMIQELCVEL